MVEAEVKAGLDGVKDKVTLFELVSLEYLFIYYVFGRSCLRETKNRTRGPLQAKLQAILCIYPFVNRNID